jgi:hypothetical protein
VLGGTFTAEFWVQLQGSPYTYSGRGGSGAHFVPMLEILSCYSSGRLVFGIWPEPA